MSSFAVSSAISNPLQDSTTDSITGSIPKDSTAQGLIPIAPPQLKFLLRLLGCPGYRSSLSNLKFQANLSPSEKVDLCHSLQSQGWIDFQQEIQSFTLAAPGEVLLKLDSRSLPITPDERSILVASRKTILSLDSLPPTAPPRDRVRLVRNLVDRGLLKVKKYQITEVWLTQTGLLYLRDECEPEGHTPWLSGDLLRIYLNFLRSALDPSQTQWQIDSAIDGEKVLAVIEALNQELNTDNYLPLFYLREKLQPPLTREALNQILYDLQRNDRLELCSIQEVSAYTPEQLKAAIPQATGGSLFFVSLTPP